MLDKLKIQNMASADKKLVAVTVKSAVPADKKLVDVTVKSAAPSTDKKPVPVAAQVEGQIEAKRVAAEKLVILGDNFITMLQHENNLDASSNIWRDFLAHLEVLGCENLAKLRRDECARILARCEINNAQSCTCSQPCSCACGSQQCGVC